MMKRMKNVMIKKDRGGLSQLLVEGGLAIAGIALLVILVVAAKPIVLDFVTQCGNKAMNIFNL